MVGGLGGAREPSRRRLCSWVRVNVLLGRGVASMAIQRGHSGPEPADQRDDHAAGGGALLELRGQRPLVSEHVVKGTGRFRWMTHGVRVSSGEGAAREL